MKNVRIVFFALAACLSLSACGQTLKREIPTTSQFSRRALTNETAAEWREMLGVQAGTNGSATIDDILIASNSIAGDLGGKVSKAGDTITGGLINNSAAGFQGNMVGGTNYQGSNIVGAVTLATTSVLASNVTASVSNDFHNASNLSSGTIPDERLSANVTQLGSSIDLSGAEATGTLAPARLPALTGDVLTSAGSAATTINTDSVGNTKLSNMAQDTIKGRATAGTGDPEDLTVLQVQNLLGLGTAAYSNSAVFASISLLNSASNSLASLISTGGEATNVLQVAAGEGVVVDTNSLVRTVSVDTNSIATRDYADALVSGVVTNNQENVRLHSPVFTNTVTFDFSPNGGGPDLGRLQIMEINDPQPEAILITNSHPYDLFFGLADGFYSFNVNGTETFEIGAGGAVSMFPIEAGTFHTPSSHFWAKDDSIIFSDGTLDVLSFLPTGDYFTISGYSNQIDVINATISGFAISGTNITDSTINSNKFDAATLALFGAGGGGDVTADGNNAFTGDNTHSGAETFSGSVILPAATVGTNDAVQAEWNDFIDARITTGTDSPTNFLGAPGSAATGASFNAGALTNASPKIATNNASASDGWVLSKSGDNLKLVAQSAGAGGGLTTNDVKAITGQTRVFNLMDYGATGDGFTDDTPAWQAALDAATAPTNKATMSILFVPIPTNFYNLSSPATNVGQSQLVIHDKDIYNTNMSTLVIMGEGYDNNWAGTAVAGAMPTANAPVIYSTSTNSGDCVLRSTINEIESPFYPTRITIEIKNISFRTSTSFRGTVINFTNVTNCSIEQSDIMKNVGPNSITFLPDANSIGFWGPDKDNGNYCYINKLNVVGYGKGVVLGEHVTAPFMNIVACRKAVVFMDSNLGNWIGHVTIQQCNYGIFFEGDSKVKIDHAVFETANADWKTNIMDISGDVNTYGHGWIGWSKKDNANSRHLDLSKERTWYIQTYSYGENALLSSSQATDLKDRGPRFQYVDNSARSAGYTFEKARGTPRDKTIVSSGDQWGPQFAGYNGTKFVTASTVYGYVDGTPSSTSMPMGIAFLTGTNDTSLTRKMEIPLNGFVKFYNTFAVTNAPTFVTTNAAPAGVTWGTTAPDAWIRMTNNGVGGSVPWFKD